MNDGDHKIDADGDPDLSLHRVGTRPVVMFDAQVPLDPAEEQLDPPTQAIKCCDGQCRNEQIVCQENQIAPGLRVEVSHLAEKQWKVLSGFCPGRFSYLVAAQSRLHVHRLRALPGKPEIVFGSRNKERSRFCDQMEALEIHVAAIHQIKRSGFEKQVVQPENVVLTGVGDENACRDRTPQIDLRMHLDPGFRLAEIGPWEKRQRQIDGGRVKRVDRVLDVEADFLPGVKRSRFGHEALGQILPEPPVALLVGIGQRGFGNRFAKTQMVTRMRSRVQTIGNVAQPLPPRQLCKSHANKLLATAEMTDAGFRVVPLDKSVECLAMDQIEDLGQDKSAGIHAQESALFSNASHAI